MPPTTALVAVVPPLDCPLDVLLPRLLSPPFALRPDNPDVVATTSELVPPLPLSIVIGMLPKAALLSLREPPVTEPNALFPPTLAAAPPEVLRPDLPWEFELPPESSAEVLLRTAVVDGSVPWLPPSFRPQRKKPGALIPRTRLPSVRGIPRDAHY